MTFQVTWYHASEASSPSRPMLPLDRGRTIVIGREDGADIVLKDKAVSRLHAEIFVDRNGAHISDRGSVNGVLVDGRRISNQVDWIPGQKVQIGPYVLELSPAPGQALPGGPPSEMSLAPPVDARPARMPRPGQGGRVSLGQVFQSARKNDPRAVEELFEGFLGVNERVVDCGYLGALGLIFPEHCFWCVTDSRVCGLMVNYAGWVRFQFGFIKALNRATFNQPSLIMLWVVVIVWILFTLLMGASAISILWNGFVLPFLGMLLITLLMAAATPLVVWLYHRFEKSGCVFWTRELVPIWIPSDRHSVHNAQKFISVFVDQRKRLGD